MTLGNPPPCSGPEEGQLWFNAQRKGLFICDGLTWRTLLQSESGSPSEALRHTEYLQQSESIRRETAFVLSSLYF